MEIIDSTSGRLEFKGRLRPVATLVLFPGFKDMLRTPLAQQIQNRFKCPAPASQGIFDSGRNFCIYFPGDQSILLQFTQLLS